MPIDPMLKPVLGTFLQEAQGISQTVTKYLLTLERGADTPAEREEAFSEVARSLHTLKGTAATFGLGELSDLAHRMENVVEAVRGEDPFPGDAADALFKAVDVFVGQIRAYAEDDEANLPELAPALRAIEQVISKRGSEDEVARRLRERKKAAADAPHPSGAETASQQSDSGEESSQRGLPSGDSDAEVEADKSPGAPAEGSAEEPPQQSRGGGGEGPEADSAGDEMSSWQVSQKDVLHLMSEAERLRELRLRLEERANQLDLGIDQLAKVRSGEGVEDVRARLSNLRAGLGADSEEAADIVDAFEQGIKTICTLPVASVLEPLHRLIRDQCRSTGKKARLSVVGGEISVDRRLLQSLRGPLVHLIRNAVDHGIEMPDVRDRAGKHYEGALTLRFEQQGNILFVELADDGSGLDTERIREEALRRGVATTDEIAQMGRREVHRLIFRTGFSTRQDVGETSGRGVGLDVVSNQLRSLQGNIEVFSEPGQGSRFVLTLPAELGSSPILILKAGDHQIGLPMIVVESVVANSLDKLQVSRSSAMLEHRDQLIPVKDLGAMLGQRQASVPEDKQPLVVLQSQGRRVAVSVDHVVGDRDLVIRPLPEELRSIGAYQGAATLARGESMLVLRPDWLAEEQAQSEQQSARRALVVDDSITARAMHRTMLESGGFVVHAASSGEQALEKVRFSPYEIVVCDLHMEGMDGIALIREMRSWSNTQHVPIILVSVTDDESVRNRATEAGADAFMTKKDCASGRLLSEVETVIARRKSA